MATYWVIFGLSLNIGKKADLYRGQGSGTVLEPVVFHKNTVQTERKCWIVQKKTIKKTVVTVTCPN